MKLLRYPASLAATLLLVSLLPAPGLAQDDSASTEETTADEAAESPADDEAEAEDELAEAEAAAAAAADFAEDEEAVEAFAAASEELATELDHRPPPSPEGVATPGDDQGDWIQINSGEWLRGEIKGMRDDVLTLDSEELDDQSFDWADIVRVHSPNVNRYIRNFDEVVDGTAEIDQLQVTVQTEEGIVVFPRSELTAILGGDDSEASRWSAFLGLGFDGNWGASEQITMSANAWLQREDASSRVRLSYDASWGQAEGTVNVNNMWGRFKYDLYISRLFYFVPLVGPTGYDEFLNLELRSAPGSAAGVHAIDSANMDFDLDAGLAYVYTRFDSVLAMSGEALKNHDLGVRFSAFYNWDITGDIEFEAKHESLLVVTNLGLSQFTTRGMVSIDLTGDLDLDLTFKHTRIREPETREDGTTPDPDQFQLTIGLGWDI